MNVWPLQFRALQDAEFLFSDDAGTYFKASEDFLSRYVSDELTDADKSFLMAKGCAFEKVGDFAFNGFAARWANRINPAEHLNYLILVPTLRCNLMCDYCQVSRAAETAIGFDWDDAKTNQVLDFIGGLDCPEIKIEFQGGEPLLRLDILKRVRDFCRSHFVKSEFVICTNMQSISNEAWDFLDAKDTHISTSFDGTMALHRENRTKSEVVHDEFSNNLEVALDRFGSDRISALPTIDPARPPEPRDVIASFADLGLTSIFLRRVNYQGFARKKYDFERSITEWRDYYRRFVRELIAYNAKAEIPLEEFYLSHILKRIMRGGYHGHVDLRNPNWLATDYLVIDFDGTFYPTDEARMVSRVGRIDLSIGTLSTGVDREKVDSLNLEVSNFDDPECTHCVYKSYCGLDLVDDLSRYGRIDMPRHSTDHCQSHLNLFDFAFDLIYSEDPDVQKSLAIWLGVPRFSPALAQRLT
ncbi:His-Xaa-Ser system radical SAM maturase HxsB [Sulfitobacter pontiacus]|uniref:His-Xaa-Ser system radical SAM maturase HxsB n=1 Tax=Sulfitobacter pontiacus TaxID=60137 RepID=UPI003159D94A